MALYLYSWFLYYTEWTIARFENQVQLARLENQVQFGGKSFRIGIYQCEILTS